MNLFINSPKYGKREVLFDDEFKDLVSKYTWVLCSRPERRKFYCFARVRVAKNTYKAIFMHRLFVDSAMVDHINGNGLDNRMVNLRGCTNQQNMMNRDVMVNKKNKFKGVYEHGNKFRALLTYNKAKIYGGHFNTKEEAAKKYNDLAKEYFGEFAKLNIL